MTTKTAWIIGGCIIAAVAIYCTAFRYVNSGGGVLDHWTGKKTGHSGSSRSLDDPFSRRGGL